VIPDRFPLQETPEDRSPLAPDIPRSQRTEWNILDSDASLILRPVFLAADPGTDWAEQLTARLGRPVLVVDPWDPDAPDRIRAWLDALDIRTLGVGGPSEGTVPGIGNQAYRLLVGVFGILSAARS
jgi:hypothetical protein